MRGLPFLAFVGAVAFSGAAQACPDIAATAAFGHFILEEGFTPDPFEQGVTAGGGYDLAACGFDTVGWVALAPDFDLTYQTSGNAPLTIRIDSDVDTILLVNDPDGEWWFDDDGAGDGFGAEIVIDEPGSGLYNIWVGTYAQASGIPATLVITEVE